jgi:hypothetical protein
VSARRAPLFPGLTTVYLKGLGELLICANRLQRVLETDASVTAPWRARADQLIGEALRVADTVAAAGSTDTVRVTMGDGTAVVVDLAYLDGLVRKMHRHHSLSVLQEAILDEEPVAS